MQFTLKHKQTDDPHDTLLVASDFVRVAPADEELSSVLHDAARHLSDAQTLTGSGVPAGPSVPPVDMTVRPVAVNDVRVPRKRWSMARAAVRGFTALLLAACIGGAAIAWQSHGDAAKQMIAAWAPPFLTSSLLPEQPGLPAQPAAPAAAQADAANAAPSQPAPPAQTAAEAVAPAATALSSESAQLQSMARDLASAGQEIEQLKTSIEQLKASQQQISRDVARVSEAKASELKASEIRAPEQNLRPKMPKISAPPRSAAAPARQPLQPYPPRQAVAPPLPQAAAAPYVPRQPEPQIAAEPPQADPDLASVPRPPMPLR